jgi:FlaA1/EpsC-like NDP-sugar epimerase
MVLHALRSAQGGEIFVPKIPSYRITDVATAIAPKAKQVVIGIRPGEKVHEEMITSSDSFTTVDLGTYYAILPQGHRYSVDDYCRSTGAKRIPEGFVYNSGTNDAWLSVEDIRKLITLHVDTSFQA